MYKVARKLTWSENVEMWLQPKQRGKLTMIKCLYQANDFLDLQLQSNNVSIALIRYNSNLKQG